MDTNKLCDDLINIYREQRHDFLNHFQVILGYLQLDKKDRAISYIKQVNSEIQSLSSITGLGNSYLVLMLLLAYQRSKSMGIELFFFAEPGLLFYRDYHKSLIDDINHILDTVFQYMVRMEEMVRWLKITLKEDSECSIWEFIFDPALPHEDLYQKLTFPQNGRGLNNGRLTVDKSRERVVIFFSIPKE